MIDLVLGVALLGLLLISAFGAVRFLERRRRSTRSPFAAGVTLVVGPDCVLCGPAERALVASGVTPAVIDVDDIPPTESIRSLPVAIVTDREGVVLMRRSGRSVITDAPEIASSARAVPSVTP